MARLNRNETGANVNSGAVAVTTTAQEVVPLRNQRVSVTMRNAGGTTVYFGKDSSVTSSTGYPLLPDEEFEFTDYVGPLYVVCATTGDLRYFEVH